MRLGASRPGGPFIRPGEHLGRFRGVGAETIGTRARADTEEVQAVGVPTGLNAKISLRKAGCMLLTRIFKEGETLIVKIKISAAKLAGKRGTAPAVPVVPGFIEAASVMEDGEEFDQVHIRAGKAGHFASILKDACPMRYAVGAGEREGIAGEDLA